MGVLDVNGISCRIPGGDVLFIDGTFRAGNGEHVALVGANGAGKTTLLRAITGVLPVDEGSVHVDGELRVLSQLVGWRDEERSVRDLVLSLSPARLQDAAATLDAAEAANDREPGERTGLALARAHTAWGDAGGWDAEVLWDT